MRDPRRSMNLWLGVGAAGFLLVPWYALRDNVFALGWILHLTNRDTAPAILQIIVLHRPWLAPLGLLLAAAVVLHLAPLERNARG